jgi:hypothetical protein
MQSAEPPPAFQQWDASMHREFAPETQGCDSTTDIQGDPWLRPQSTRDGEPVHSERLLEAVRLVAANGGRKAWSHLSPTDSLATF